MYKMSHTYLQYNINICGFTLLCLYLHSTYYIVLSARSTPAGLRLKSGQRHSFYVCGMPIVAMAVILCNGPVNGNITIL